jgi:hypothetical protein
MIYLNLRGYSLILILLLRDLEVTCDLLSMDERDIPPF